MVIFDSDGEGVVGVVSMVKKMLNDVIPVFGGSNKESAIKRGSMIEDKFDDGESRGFYGIAHDMGGENGPASEKELDEFEIAGDASVFERCSSMGVG